MIIYYYVLLKSEIITNRWAHLMDVASSIPFSFKILSDLLTFPISPNLLKVQSLLSYCPQIRYYCFQCSSTSTSSRGLHYNSASLSFILQEQLTQFFLKVEHWGPAYMPKTFRESGNLTDKLFSGPGCISG